MPPALGPIYVNGKRSAFQAEDKGSIPFIGILSIQVETPVKPSKKHQKPHKGKNQKEGTFLQTISFFPHFEPDSGSETTLRSKTKIEERNNMGTMQP